MKLLTLSMSFRSLGAMAQRRAQLASWRPVNVEVGRSTTRTTGAQFRPRLSEVPGEGVKGSKGPTQLEGPLKYTS